MNSRKPHAHQHQLSFRSAPALRLFLVTANGATRQYWEHSFGVAYSKAKKDFAHTTFEMQEVGK